MHEIGHVMKGDFGISFEGETGEAESAADEYAENKLIDPASYESFIEKSRGRFTIGSIIAFADSIDRDPGIILGRLENDGYVDRRNALQFLKIKYRVSVA